MTSTTPKASEAGRSGHRGIWVAIILLAAGIVGSIATLLAYAGGSKVPTAILTGGGAFGATVLLLITIAHYIAAEG